MSKSFMYSKSKPKEHNARNSLPVNSIIPKLAIIHNPPNPILGVTSKT